MFSFLKLKFIEPSLIENLSKIVIIIVKILRNFGFGVVQRFLNLVDLEKCEKCIFGCKNQRQYSRERAPPKVSNFL